MLSISGERALHAIRPTVATSGVDLMPISFRMKCEPLQYIVGETQFHDLLVGDQRALILGLKLSS